LETENKLLYLYFNEQGIDKSIPARVVDKLDQSEVQGRLCLGKRDLKGFLYID
jgi:hypothetical protein